MSEGRRTALYETHAALGAKFVPFAGWEMPVQYTGVVLEHLAVRNSVGMFDVSHMGEIVVRGEGALSFLQHVTSNDVSVLEIGAAQYSLLMRENGAVVDDIIIYRTAQNEYFLCVNAANTEKDFRHLKNYAKESDIEVLDLSSHFGQIALQGPEAAAVLAKYFDLSAADVSRAHFKAFRFQIYRADYLVARTGYTGEDGFEIFFPASEAPTVWADLWELVAAHGGLCCGLAARDTLRLEAAFPLYGHELSDNRSPVSANLKWVIKTAKGDFLGKALVLNALAHGTSQQLVGFEVISPGIVREGAIVRDIDGKAVGEITSGTKTPSLPRPIALGFLDREFLGTGVELFAEVRGKLLSIQQVKLPFYRSPHRV